jgi:hypothetical protein
LAPTPDGESRRRSPRSAGGGDDDQRRDDDPRREQEATAPFRGRPRRPVADQKREQDGHDGEHDEQFRPVEPDHGAV